MRLRSLRGSGAGTRALTGLLVVLLVVLGRAGAASGQLPLEDEVAEPDQPIDPAPLDQPPAGAPPSLTAPGAVLWDPADEAVLYGVEADVARPMASLTKIMTILLAIEAGTVDDVVTVSAAAASLGGATLGLQPGQQVPMRSLIAGLLVRSGNDAALAVAQHVSGDEAAFVARMNERAAELGLRSMRFVNASGLTDDPGHRASPLDLARLGALAMEHPVFAEYAGARHVTVEGLAPMENRNELIGVYPGMTGVKTGFTTLAGLCLVGSATRDDRTLYAVVLGSDDSFTDVAALLDHGFTAFRRAEPAGEGTPVTEYRWADAAVDVVADGPLGATVPTGERVTWRTELAPALERPLAEGAPAGTAQLLVGDELRVEVPLRVAAPVAEPTRAASPAAEAGAAVQEALRVFSRLHAVDRAA